MTHEEAAALLPELAHGRLEPAVRNELMEHLAGCEDCRALDRTHRLLRATLEQEKRAEVVDHPAVAAIVAYAVDRPSLDPDGAIKIAGHLSSCETCSDAVERTRRVHASVLPKTDPGVAPSVWMRFGPRSVASRIAVAAALALGAVLAVGGAWMGLVWLPEAGQRADTLASQVQDLTSSLDGARERLARLETWSGPVELSMLSSLQRDPAAAPTVRLRRGQPYALLAIELDLALTSLTDQDVGFEIRAPEGSVVWSADLPAERVRGDVEAVGVVAFLVPARSLQPGANELRVVLRGDPGAKPLLIVWFDLEAEP